MKIYQNVACALALLSMAGPAFADVRTTAFTDSADRSAHQTSMFVGATVRFDLNRRQSEPRYRAALGISGMARERGTSNVRVGQGLEMSFSGKGKPALTLAGSDAGELWQAAKMSGGGKVALIVGGTVALLGVAALVAYNSLPCTDDDDPCD